MSQISQQFVSNIIAQANKVFLSLFEIEHFRIDDSKLISGGAID